MAEEVDHPYTLSFGLFALGLIQGRRGDLMRATQVLERDIELCRTWQFALLVSAALGAAYTMAGRSDDATTLLAGPGGEFRRRELPHIRPALFLLCAGKACLSIGRFDEAANHTREALAPSRRLGARGSEAHALCKR